MNRIKSILLGCAALLCANPAGADDSSAALGAGGVALTQSADIRMAAEDLRISPKEVRIRFAFANDSAKDIDTVVAFPLPDIDTSQFYEEPLGTTTKDPVNFIGFDVMADGKKIPFQVEQRAIYKGRDVTDIVKSAGVPVNIVDPSFVKTIDGLSTAKRKVLAAADLIDLESGAGVHPHWVARTKFFWHQLFPAGKTVVFEQRYQPVTGQSFFGGEELKGGEDAHYWQENFCLDASTRATITARLAAYKKVDKQNGGMLNAFTTDYILITGNNWKGPIGKFHLTIDKLKPENVLSMCWDGELKKTGATTFEAMRENFAPQHDIKLLVLSTAPSGD
jgi:Domain of unknown function (DUF4424)